MDMKRGSTRVMGRREMSQGLRHTAKKTISRPQPTRVAIPELRDTRHCQSTREYCLAEVRSSVEMSTSPPTTVVIGRRQERMMKKQMSDNWEIASVDSGVGSDFSCHSSRSTLNSVGGLSRHSSVESVDQQSFCDSSNIYATVGDNTMLDNTYASIHTVDAVPAPVLPPKLPPRNKRQQPYAQQQQKSYLDCSDYSNISCSTTSSNSSNDVIVTSRFHTYTVDDIVDSYFSLVSAIPKETTPLSPRCKKTTNARKTVMKYNEVYL